MGAWEEGVSEKRREREWGNRRGGKVGTGRKGRGRREEASKPSMGTGPAKGTISTKPGWLARYSSPRVRDGDCALGPAAGLS